MTAYTRKPATHLEAMRELPCVVCGEYGTTEMAHLTMHSILHGKFIGAKSDGWVTPLCSRHHAQQHQLGERAFWRRQPINPFVLALALWRVSPNVVLMERVIAEHRHAHA
jgi:hypothetical protein